MPPGLRHNIPEESRISLSVLLEAKHCSPDRKPRARVIIILSQNPNHQIAAASHGIVREPQAATVPA